jgi:TrmH family RNA methyltransferase
MGFIDNHPDFDIYATDLKSQRYLDEMKITAKKIAIILGNEGSGVSQEILAKVNNSFKLKMSNMESLNVGVAGSIILYELSKRSL